MYIEINVVESANSPLSMNRVFSILEKPKRISKVRTYDPENRERLCEVVGWSSNGPCSAYATLAEDSGEGVVMLIYGGDEGIRLKPAELQEAWDLNSPRQWGEACLLIDKDAEVA